MNNTKEYILACLEKYWAGDSSLEEDRALREYFSGQTVAPDLKSFQPLFQYFEEEKLWQIDVTDDVMSKINQQPSKTKIIPLGWKKIIRIAASLLLFLSLGLAIYQYQSKPKMDFVREDTFEDPEEALRQTKAALAYLSSRMNKATDKASKSISKTGSLDILN